MLIVQINEGENIERALKKFKRKFNMTGVMRQLKEREQFVKKSIKKRRVVNKAKYVQKLKLEEEE